MSERGVFAVDRGVFDHPMFASSEPFTEREAWIWMLSAAAWKAARVRVGVAVVALARGEFAHSVRFLGTKWRWHPAKVQRFLKRLKTETMIDTRADDGITIITICKYSEYQRVSLPSDTRADTPSDTPPIQQRYREEDIQDIKQSPSPPARDLASEAVEIFNIAAREAGWPTVQRLTTQRRSAVLARIADGGGDIAGWQAAIDKGKASAFLRGENAQGWKADFDFICQAKSYTKLMEGSYDDRKPSPGNASGQRNSRPDDPLLSAVAASLASRTGHDQRQAGPDGGNAADRAGEGADPGFDIELEATAFRRAG